MQAHRRPFVSAIIAIAGALHAQTQPRSIAPAFRTDSRLVLIPITVIDRQGATVVGLPRDAFTITEDGIRQQIHSFTEDDAPVSLGIVFDISGSMKSVLGAAKASLRALMKDASPADEAFLNAVSTRPRSCVGFTNDFDELLKQIAFEDADGNTALFDTICASLKQLRSGVHARKALLIISDGVDNHSRHSREELLEEAAESDVQIYTIAIDRAPLTSKPIERLEEKRGLLFLDELAAKTGGTSFIVRGGTDIREAAARIGQALRNQYTIGYVPRGNVRGGQWRRIKVRVAGSGMRAYARAGYRLD